MSLKLNRIEEFFRTQFDASHSLNVLAHFDGYAHWTVLFDQDNYLLKLMADEKGWVGYPTFEMEIWCTGAYYGDNISFAGEFLALRPRGYLSSENLVILVRKYNSRISLSTRISQSPDTEIFKIPEGWFEIEN